jgi:hypothetical protein
MPVAPFPRRPPCRHRGSMINRVLKRFLACARQWPRRQ